MQATPVDYDNMEPIKQETQQHLVYTAMITTQDITGKIFTDLTWGSPSTPAKATSIY